jgi:hypothetical protein
LQGTQLSTSTSTAMMKETIRMLAKITIFKIVFMREVQVSYQSGFDAMILTANDNRNFYLYRLLVPK